ncbi:unnamed protein product [Wickerhamomyces anomalus]
MSVENLPMNNVNRANLSIMLPDPTRYPLQNVNTYNNNVIVQQNNNTQFTLPPIRELLKSTSPVPTPQNSETSLLPPPPPSQQQQQQQQQILQPQPIAYQSPFSNPISPISTTPEQQLRTQPTNLIPRSNSFQYSHQPPQFQPHHQLPQFYPQQQVSAEHLSPSSLNSTRSSSSSPVDVVVAADSSKEKSNMRKKRQNLPRQTTLILLSWLSEHLDRPYPNSREKYELLMKTRLTIQQLDNWFINARRRKINVLRKLKENDQNIALTF